MISCANSVDWTCLSVSAQRPLWFYIFVLQCYIILFCFNSVCILNFTNILVLWTFSTVNFCTFVYFFQSFFFFTCSVVVFSIWAGIVFVWCVRGVGNSAYANLWSVILFYKLASRFQAWVKGGGSTFCYIFLHALIRIQSSVFFNLFCLLFFLVETLVIFSKKCLNDNVSGALLSRSCAKWRPLFCDCSLFFLYF
jgi:hypothetical protein